MSIPTLLSELAHAHRRSFTINDLAAAAARMDADICRALHEFGHALGRRLADAVVILDPDSIVVDGALESAATVIANGVREAINRYAPPAMANGVTVKPGELGTAAHLKGAAALVRTEGVHSQRRS